MAKHAGIFFLVIALGCATLFGAVLTPIETTGYDQDIVFEAGMTASQIGANGELGSRQFFEAGVYADGVPQVTNIVSVLTSNSITFAFQPFNQNNILKFDNVAPAKTLTFSSPAAYTQLAIVHSGGSLALTEVAALNYAINYSGGLTQTGSVNSADWGAVPALPPGTERLMIADRTSASATTWPVNSDNNTTANRWGIYVSEVTTARPDLNIESITFGPVTFTNGAPLIAGDDVVVFGVAGELGNIVLEPPVITNEPVSLTIAESQSATFTVGASGSPLAYHWHQDDAPIAGANNASYTISQARLSDAGSFFVVVSNSLGTATSAIVTLTVNPDTNGPTVVSAIGELAPNTVTVTFSEPIEPTAVSQGSFNVFLTGTDPDSGLLTTDYLLTNNNRTAIITTEPRAPGVNYSIRVTGILDSSAQQNPLSPDPTFLTLRTVFQLIGFDDNNVWKWTAETNLFGTGWETVNYDDSDPLVWLEGPAGLGNDLDNAISLRTTTAYATNSAPQFFRRHFSLPSSTNGVELRMRHVFEDGAVVYINGQEAGRFNVSPGPLSVATRTPAGAAGVAPIAGPVVLPLTNVIPGDNVIAVAVIQNGATSSDIFMAIELTASIPVFSEGPPYFSVHPQTQTFIEGQTVALSAVAEGFQPMSYQWRKDGTNILGATNSSYTIFNAWPTHSGTYDVVATNISGIATSAPAVVRIECDCVGPAFMSAVANTNLTNILLTFSEPVEPNSAQNTNSYDVHLTAGGGNLTVLAASRINGTNILLTTSSRTPGYNYTIVLSGITDTAVGRNPVFPSSRAIAVQIIILAPDDVTLWRYNSASNNLDGTGWQLPGFDASAWPTALAGFTTSNDWETATNGFEIRSTNMIAPGSGGPVTAYYRVPFTLPGSIIGAQLRLVGVVDDGLVAYINGVEAGRLRITNASPVSFTNLATGGGPEVTTTNILGQTNHVHLPLETIILTNLSGLVSGANLLAIELHQNSLTSSDAVLSLQIIAELSDIVDCFPRLTISQNPATGQVTVSWGNCGVLQQTTELPSTGPVWTDVPGNPNPYVFTPTGETRFFSLRP